MVLDAQQKQITSMQGIIQQCDSHGRGNQRLIEFLRAKLAKSKQKNMLLNDTLRRLVRTSLADELKQLAIERNVSKPRQTTAMLWKNLPDCWKHVPVEFDASPPYDPMMSTMLSTKCLPPHYIRQRESELSKKFKHEKKLVSPPDVPVIDDIPVIPLEVSADEKGFEDSTDKMTNGKEPAKNLAQYTHFRPILLPKVLTVESPNDAELWK